MPHSPGHRPTTDSATHVYRYELSIDTASLRALLPIVKAIFLTDGDDIMSKLTEALDRFEAKIATETAQVTKKVDGLKDQVAALQAKLEEGSATPEELARLDSLIEKIDMIDPTTESTLPSDGEPTPEPAPVDPTPAPEFN